MDREHRIATRDHNRTVAAYAARGRSRHFAGEPLLVDLAFAGLRLCPCSTRKAYKRRLEALEEPVVAKIAATIPEERMSHLARAFSVKLVVANRRRLLDGFGACT